MEQRPQHPQAHLFTVRLWQEEQGDGKPEWSGRAQDIANGGTEQFQGWPGLVAALTHLIETSEAPPGDPAQQPPC
jgi:hypothetical protein